jgi:hypothetical protein
MIRALETAEPRYVTQSITETSPLLDGAGIPAMIEISQPMCPRPTNPGLFGPPETQAEFGYLPDILISPSASANLSHEISVPPTVSPSSLNVLSDGSSSLGDHPQSERVWVSQLHIMKHVPIIAVSASLDRHTKESLTTDGLDGWLSKPINFKQLGVMLQGMTSQNSKVGAISTG